MRVRQHVPNWADCDPKFDDVSSLNELLSLPWVQSWERMHEHGPFVGWRRSDDKGDLCSLMALYGKDESYWWVVAEVPQSLVSDLAIWCISPAGRAKVDKWNKGDWS